MPSIRKRKCPVCKKTYGREDRYAKLNRQKTCSKECGYKVVSKKLKNDGNGNWKGKSVGYAGIHCWIKRRIKKPKLCTKCKKRKAHDIANISQKYKRDLKDWEWLCRRCHMVKDGRMSNLKVVEKGSKLPEETKQKISLGLLKHYKSRDEYGR